MNQQQPAYDAYRRQMILPGFGQAAQDKLATSRVLVVGAGGLGCPVLQYLAAAGVGHLGIADGDVVNLSNLHRQVLYSAADAGQPKAQVAAARLQAQYPHLTVTTIAETWTAAHCVAHMDAYDVVVDGTDHFGSKYMLNDACVLFGKPLVYGAVSQWQGQIAVFNAALPTGGRSAHYRHLFAQPPAAGTVASCEEAGVVGMLPGIIGSMQAIEVLKLLTGLGEPLYNQLLTYDAARQTFYKMKLPTNVGVVPDMPVSTAALLQWNYDDACASSDQSSLAVDAATALHWLASGALLVDVREPDELPVLQAAAVQRLPMALALEKTEWEGEAMLLFVCQRGQRSMQVATRVKELYPCRKVGSISGGVVALLAQAQAEGSSLF